MTTPSGRSDSLLTSFPKEWYCSSVSLGDDRLRNGISVAELKTTGALGVALKDEERLSFDHQLKYIYYSMQKKLRS